MRVRIFQPSKTAMQSGQGGTKRWLLEFEADTRREIDPLMGWTSSRDTRTQVRLSFDSVEEAVAYAKKQGYAYAVEPPHRRTVRPKNYSDNFRSDRFGNWTH
ncbi:MAG: ETC complex I subunit [Dongiaceae bacterium]